MTSRIAGALILSLGLAALLSAQTPQIVRGPYLQLGTEDAISIRWRTDVATDSKLWWGAAPGSLLATMTRPGSRTDHEIRINGLAPRTVYHYAVGNALDGMLAGNDAQHRFRTAAVPGSRDRLRFWVLGDSGTGNQDARDVRDAYYGYAPSVPTDFMLMLGDNAYNDGTDAEYQTAVFQNMYEDLLRQVVVWPAYGNHDAHSADATNQTGPYFDIFSLPTTGEAGGLASGTEAYYAFDQGNVHFVVLDSQTSDRSPTGAMATWLAADLATTTQDWIVAYWHHPPFSKGTHDSDTEGRLIDMRQNILPILEAGGVDLVLSGHSHGYERSMLIDAHTGLSPTFDVNLHAKDAGSGRMIEAGAYRKPAGGVANAGEVCIVAGSSGKIGAGSYDHPVMIASMARLGSLVVDVLDQQMTLRFLDAGGQIQDFFTLVKEPVRPTQMIRLPVAYGGIWKFQDAGVDLGTAWRAPGYDDSSWSSGPAPLGYGESWVQTPISFGANAAAKPPTAYFRKSFVYDGDPQTLDVMHLGVLYDDGFVAYLNGQEIARSDSMPAGAVSFGTLAASHEAAEFELFDVSAHKALLLRGGNLLAIEVHQTSATSSDLVIEAALLTDGLDPVMPPAAASSVLDAQGRVEEPFRIQSSNGGYARSVDVGLGQPFSFSMDPPSLSGGSAPFTIFGYLGTPSAAEAFPLPFGLGPMAFAPAFPGVFAPQSFLVADNFIGLTGALAYSAPAPWSATNPGLNFPGEFSFQGWIATGPSSAKVFNAIRMRVLP